MHLKKKAFALCHTTQIMAGHSGQKEGCQAIGILIGSNKHHIVFRISAYICRIFDRAGCDHGVHVL